MKYSVAAISAFVALVAAQPAFLNSAFDVEEGKPFELKFSGCEGGCTITIQNGESDNTKDVRTLTSSADGDSFTFTPSDLPSGTYNFKITNNDSKEENYSAQFEYSGTGSITSGSSSAATSTGSATATEESSSTESETTATSETTETSASTTETSSSTVVETVSKNGTTTHTSATRPPATRTQAETTGASSTGSATSVPESGASRMTSSLALIAGAVMAMVYLN